jgi:hypothetical protein
MNKEESMNKDFTDSLNEYLKDNPYLKEALLGVIKKQRNEQEILQGLVEEDKKTPTIKKKPAFVKIKKLENLKLNLEQLQEEEEEEEEEKEKDEDGDSIFEGLKEEGTLQIPIKNNTAFTILEGCEKIESIIGKLKTEKISLDRRIHILEGLLQQYSLYIDDHMDDFILSAINGIEGVKGKIDIANIIFPSYKSGDLQEKTKRMVNKKALEKMLKKSK